MPSPLHEVLVLLFRNRPELAVELLGESLGLEVPAYNSVRLESADLTQIVPAAYHADLVAKLERNGKPVLGIVVEVQLRRKRRKLFTWLLYVAALRATLECPTCVLVITPDARVAAWAARPIVFGPRSVFQPLVLGPEQIPVIDDDQRAADAPELAVLSAMAHARGDPLIAARVTRAMRRACARLEPERATVYYDVVDRLLSDAARAELEAIMEARDYKYKSEFSRKHIAIGKAEGRAEGKAEGRAEGKAEGRAEGKAEGRAEGKAEGRAEGKAEAVLAVLKHRGLSVSDEQRARILACTDLAIVDAWLDAAFTVSDVRELLDGR